jgi:DUF4097 and DUF4098 domain-containing protein YvlB
MSIISTAVGKATIEARDFVESNYCHLQSQEGDIVAAGIKTGTLSIQSGSGEVICSGNVQGNIAIKTTSGNVIGDKRLTGQALEISTESGDIRLASCYSDYSKFSTNTGSMYLRNLHHEAYVAVYERGDVNVLGMDGSANVFVKQVRDRVAAADTSSTAAFCFRATSRARSAGCAPNPEFTSSEGTSR